MKSIEAIPPENGVGLWIGSYSTSAYYGQRAEQIRANGAAVRSKRREPSYVT